MKDIRTASGFGLIEVLVATLVTMTAVVGVAGLMMYGVRLQVNARDLTDAQYVADEQMERLRVLPRTHASRQVGGSLTADVANYNDRTNLQLRTRWQVVAGPAGTRDVTLVVIPTDPRVPPTQVRARLW